MAYFKLPSGVQDLLPEECYNLNILKDKLSKKFTDTGCRFISGSAIEYYDNFACIKNSVPQEVMFKMTDRDGKLLVLRPDMTLSAARIAATRLKENNVKLCYISDVWNYSASEGVKQREFLQAGVEFLGVSSPFSDAQTIAFAIECLNELGVSDFIIDIGHVGFFKGLLSDGSLKADEAEEIRRCINAKDNIGVQMLLGKSSASEEATKALMALPTLFGGEEVFARAEKLTKNPLALESLNYLKEVYCLLKDFGFEKYVSVDLGTVKSLAYYSGVVFTGLVKNFGSDVLSGGRYDNLADEFGKHIPATGFAIGLKRVLMVLERQNALLKESEPDVIIFSEVGAEKVAYEEYKKLLSCGKKVELFAGSEDEAREYIKNFSCEKYKAVKGGLERV